MPTKIRKVTLCLIGFGICAVISVIHIFRSDIQVTYWKLPNWFQSDDLVATNYKRILVWNSPWRIETAAFGSGHQVFRQHHCPVVNCVLSTNSSDYPLESYDAIIIQMHELWMSKLPKLQRKAEQRFIFLSQESPLTLPIRASDYNNYFNWTMTYRLDSDIPLFYGRVHPLPSLNSASLDEQKKSQVRIYAQGKTKLAAWFVSHCNTIGGRDEYVRELQKYITVDVYGGCGNLTCQRNHTHWLSHPDCYVMLNTTYKFYLSFENALCNDYVTEKFFNILALDVVPVVFGGARYRDVAPAHSYIEALRFSPRQLAEYLLLLDSNDHLYNEYFWWKDYYTVESGVDQMARNAFCTLCAKLHANEPAKTYDNLHLLWSPETQCVAQKLNFSDEGFATSLQKLDNFEPYI